MQIALEKEKLLQMFVSKDRNQFADEMLTEIIENVVCWRSRIILPSYEEFLKGIDRVLAFDDKAALAAHLARTEVNAVEMGKKLLGRELSEHAARKSLYVTKQMNTTLMQQEVSLQNLKTSEQEYAAKKSKGDVYFKDNPHDTAYFFAHEMNCQAVDYTAYKYLVKLKLAMESKQRGQES